ncbi:hypothetical protein DC363_12860 [Thalassorhabdomicrobium marinisediminis]|uniref:Uncharacterized protein n=1 Tax=Thalassorhabdomicrobium marinisediminis TaxID=2170577 RepID=A0A2T7FU73_9RHOB|nr:hypothetical protein DC363_12860 [Thalassorhabdomicrobium marinisediminis]
MSQDYAAFSENFTRCKVSLSDHRFRSRRWQGYIENIRSKREKSQIASADHNPRLLDWSARRSSMCKYITAHQVAALLASKLVTRAQIQAAGLRS